jgi:glutamate--cysteine ligase
MLMPRTLRALPFVEHMRLGARAMAWREHLSTLFPEVRPKGYLEVRSIDAQPIDALAQPLLLVSTLARDGVARRTTRELIGPADPALLARAARHGTRDPELARLVGEVMSLVALRAEKAGIGAGYGE